MLLAENTPTMTGFAINLRVNMDINAKDIQYIASKGTGRYLYTDATNGLLRFNYNGTNYTIDPMTYFQNKQRNFISLVLHGGNLYYQVNANTNSL